MLIQQANAQIAVVKMVGKNTSNYGMGYGDGTALVPLKLVYRYTFNR